MIGIKEAVKIATDHMAELYSENQFAGVSLEEVELSPDEKSWLVTLSFSDSHAKSAIEAMTGQELKPRHKIFTIEAESGSVRSMKST